MGEFGIVRYQVPKTILALILFYISWQTNPTKRNQKTGVAILQDAYNFNNPIICKEESGAGIAQSV